MNRTRPENDPARIFVNLLALSLRILAARSELAKTCVAHQYSIVKELNTYDLGARNEASTDASHLEPKFGGPG